MSFVLNGSQQISLFDSLAFLSERKQRMLEKSWAQAFSDHIFSDIDAMIFAPFTAKRETPAPMPNAPVNVIVGTLILKELMGLSDDEVMEECEYDFRFQYTLHTTSFEDQPISDRTFSRFRERAAAYELVTGTDLIHTCVAALAEKIREFMDISPDIKRMDSMMIESNIKKMGRLELLYTCLSNLVRTIHRENNLELPKDLEPYADPNNRNRVIYYGQDIPQNERLQKVIDDAVELMPLCKDGYEHTEEYQLLLRAIGEQTKKDDKGNRVPKEKGDGMDSAVLQNSSDPDATYRAKAGKQHHGYVANLTETVDKKGSVVTDYQYDVNTRSDASFLKEVIEEAEVPEGTVTFIADGAYNSQEIQDLAAEKNIRILTTGLLGRKPKEILAEFQMANDGRTVLSCSVGHQPKSCCYSGQLDSVRVSFHCSQCDGCLRQGECDPDIKKCTSVMVFSLRSRQKVLERQTVMDDAVRKLVGRIHNSIETTPSVIRNKYGVDKMPVRGKLRTKLFFGFKVAALSFTKLKLFIEGKEKCRAFVLA